MNTFSVSKLPKRIERLDELAHNLWWSWHADAREMFKALDRFLWKATIHDPVKLLHQIEPCRLVAAAENRSFLKKYDLVLSEFDRDLSGTGSWFSNKHPDLASKCMAYFSPEFAIHNSLPIYAGGLGILAGDYCKEASDLGIPLVGVGFMYPKGYFRQRISSDGWQEEVSDQLNFDDTPILPVTCSNGNKLIIEVPLDSKMVGVSVWQVNVGRVKLFLLDTNVDQNQASDRQLSACLYAGDRELRLQQEIILGVGGVRVLRALKIDPLSWHANEGHVTFMMLERIREHIQAGIDFKKAVKIVQASTIFTTHTPVPAGTDTFSLDLMQKYFHSYWESTGFDRSSFLEFGIQASDPTVFNMTVLGLKLADYRNGVSKLHGGVCRHMWNSLWPDVKEDNVPISGVTNGVHIPTWIAPQVARLYDKYLGQDWLRDHDNPAIWERILEIPDEELWSVHHWLKGKLISCMLDRARKRWCEDRVKSVQALAMGGLLDPEALTLGFCRRFTEYKRASLITMDLERLKKLLLNNLQPVQIIFAGKAHPNDGCGKQLMREVYNMTTDPQFGSRIAFVEDYDMHISRYLVQGVDVWLNTPRMFQEASGTSGMKASLNGIPHLSILDGWWYEGYNGANGWAIENNSRSYESIDDDRTIANSLYSVLEKQVIPLYYERDMNGVPHGWIKVVKEAIRSNAPLFSARRMAKDYAEQMYLPAINNSTTVKNESGYLVTSSAAR